MSENAASGSGSLRCRKNFPFAGHPTLGTAYALRGDSGVKEIVLELNVGKVPVRFEETTGQPVFGEMTQMDPVFGAQHDREAVARATGLSVEDFDPTLPIQTVSTGLAFTVTPLRSLAIIQKLRVDMSRAGEYLEKTGGKFMYFVAVKPWTRPPVCTPGCCSTTAKIRPPVLRRDVRLRGWWPTE